MLGDEQHKQRRKNKRKKGKLKMLGEEQKEKNN